MKRYDFIKKIVSVLKDEPVICNLGHPAQELFQIKDSDRYFYMLGSMGLASSIGLGLSLAIRDKVVVIEGDGSILMNLGSLVTIAGQNPPNLVLIVIDNGAYWSTGDQATYTAGKASLLAIARGAGFGKCRRADGRSIVGILKSCLLEKGPHFILAEAEPGAAPVSPIPAPPDMIKETFKKALEGRKNDNRRQKDIR